jgi:MoaA/NifB/PqqE/SkfB family radical SAM enzyme
MAYPYACRYPLKAVHIFPNTKDTPCCRFHERHLKAPDERESIKGYRGMFSAIRNDMQRGRQVLGCEKCYEQDNEGIDSMRAESYRLFDNDDVALECIEISVGRLCNLACISCGIDSSTTWEQDAHVWNNKIKIPLETEVHIPLEKDVYKDLKILKITGGEPFLHIKFLKFLKFLVDNDIAKNVEIEIFTNTTFYPTKLDVRHLLRFKSVTLSCSIDGIGKVNEFLRYPSKWQAIEEIFVKWKTLADENENVNINVACTVGWLNVLYVKELLHWVRIHHDTPMILQFIDSPSWLSITCLPIEHKEKLRYALGLQFDEFYHKRQKYDNIYNQLLAKINDKSGSFKEWEVGREKVELMAKHRKQEFGTAFKKFFELIYI